MKKFIAFLSMILVITGLSGCSSFEIGYIGNSASHYMKASYTMLSGTKEGTVKVKENKPIEVSVDILTKSGSIDIFILKDKDTYEYEGHNLKTQKFTVTLKNPGTYTIQVKAKKHKGHYYFTW